MTVDKNRSAADTREYNTSHVREIGLDTFKGNPEMGLSSCMQSAIEFFENIYWLKGNPNDNINPPIGARSFHIIKDDKSLCNINILDTNVTPNGLGPNAQITLVTEDEFGNFINAVFSGSDLKLTHLQSNIDSYPDAPGGLDNPNGAIVCTAIARLLAYQAECEDGENNVVECKKDGRIIISTRKKSCDVDKKPQTLENSDTFLDNQIQSLRSSTSDEAIKEAFLKAVKEIEFDKDITCYVKNLIVFCRETIMERFRTANYGQYTWDISSWGNSLDGATLFFVKDLLDTIAGKYTSAPKWFIEVENQLAKFVREENELQTDRQLRIEALERDRDKINEEIADIRSHIERTYERSHFNN